MERATFREHADERGHDERSQTDRHGFPLVNLCGAKDVYPQVAEIPRSATQKLTSVTLNAVKGL
jgi:hypothetical protein